MFTGVSEKNLPNLIKELIEEGYTNISVKKDYSDIWIVNFSK